MTREPAPLKRIAAIHDMSGLGKCSLTVALPVISASGTECACIPTALLSTHTGEFKNIVVRDLSELILPVAEHWVAEGARFDGIYSGYLSSPAQEKLLETVFGKLTNEETLVVVDPVMADNGKYYHGFDRHMRDAFRRLIKSADIITPNITEAALLTDVPYAEPPHEIGYVESLLDRLRGTGPKVIVITGVYLSENEIGSVALDIESGAGHVFMRPVYPGVFYGTGDLFTSSLAALLVRGAGLESALSAATQLVAESIELTYRRGAPRRFGVDFETALPGYIQRVSKIFGE